MADPGESQVGVFASLTRLLKTSFAIAHNRLELALVELREERWRFFDTLLLGGLVLILVAMTLLVASVAIVVVCVKAGRLDLVVLLTALYLLGAIISFWRLRQRLKNWEPFSATVAELKKDKVCWDEKS
ncbi:MAG TPA: phage holin family protein [Candidatus Paceibacterota bacterium]|nr:phage holin family protein [Verrucomicrobiota bacterium]HSA09480.1 phage holin family protein [Candidatus Paceibacterota bacterium]